MNHEQIETFLAVVHNGSFCQAAKALYMSQPAVTHRIKTLETELGAQLFIRSNPRLTLTNAGAAFVEEAQALQMAFQHAREAMQIYHERTASIVVGFPEIMLQGVCQAFLAIMQQSKAFAPMQLHSLLLDKPPHYHSKLLTGEADLIFTDIGLPDIASEDFGRRLIFPGCAYVCMHKNHPLAARKQLRMQDLGGHTLQRYPDSTCFNEQFWQLLDKSGIRVQQQNSASFAEALRMLRPDSGLVPCNVRLLQPPGVVYLPILDASFDVGLVWLKSRETLALHKVIQLISDLPAETWRT